LSPQQVADLHKKLRDMRHDINGVLAIIVGTLEVMRLYPNDSARFMNSLGQQPVRVTNALKQFSTDFEHFLGITKPEAEASAASSKPPASPSANPG